MEVLVALMLVSVGLLGMAGTSALSLRSVTSSVREHAAVRRLRLRLAALSSAGCGHAEGGSATSRGDGVEERWTVGAPARGAVMIEARAYWLDGTNPRVLLARSALLC